MRTIVAVVLLMGIGLSYAEKPVRADGSEPPLLLPIPTVDRGHPKLDSRLNQLRSRTSSPNAVAAFAQQAGVGYAGGRVRVIVEALPDQVAAAEAAARGLGTVETQHGGLLQVMVPVPQLAVLADNQSVRRVRTPLKFLPDVVSQGVSLINANTWHNASITGAGVKIGIIDLGFSGYTSLLGTELPSSVTARSFRADNDISGGGENHGTAVTEIIYDVAPGAQLYLANFNTDVEAGNAVDWMIAQGVKVISASWGSPIGGPGDGTGSLDELVDRARTAGILWVNAAGNEAQRHWQGNFVDTDGDGATDFSQNPFDETNNIVVSAGQTVEVALKWDDPWGASSNDYDLGLYRYSNGWISLAASNSIQNGNDDPVEFLSYTAQQNDNYYIWISKKPGAAVKNLHLYSFYQTLQYQTAAGSLVQPADSLNALTVGAVYWNNPTTLESFSSQGPTKDGRVKPDLVAPDGVSTVAYSPGSFYGTSASTPHVAAAAALVKQLYPAYTPAQIQSYLESRVIDLGAGGKDNVYGSGRLNLGSLTASVTTNNATNTALTTAQLNGNLASLGTAGSVNLSFQWGTSSDNLSLETEAVSTSSLGTFSGSLTGLTSNTTYYFRAKVVGDGTSYGEGKTFTTLSYSAPALTTDNATSISYTTALMNGNLTSKGTAPNLRVSFQWGTASSNLTQQFTAASANETGPFSGGLVGLSPNTTYYFRAEAIALDSSNVTLGTFFGAEKTFTTLVGIPIVTTDNVSSIDFTTAVLSGNLTSKGNASSANVSFKWGTTSGNLTAETTPVSVNVTGPFSANITGLSPYTWYYFQAKASGNGTAYGDELSVRTLGTAPTVVTDNATSIGFYSALVSGNLTSRGTASSSNVTFQWGTVSGNYTAETSGASVNATGPFSANITGLSPATTYYFRARAQGHGSGYGSEKSFTTDSTPPSVNTDNATDIGYFSARLSGNVTSKGTAASVTTSFRWGMSSGNLTQQFTVATTNNTGAFYSDPDGLSANTTYYFQARATGHGIGDGEEKSFTTLPTTPPSVSTDNASNVTPYTVRLNGNLTDKGTAISANVTFRWGPTSGNYTNETTAQSVNSTGAFYYDLSGLSDNTTYYFRARADAGAHGDDSGEEVSFTTLVPVPPSLTTDNASNVSYFSALLSGNLTSRGTVSSANVSFQWGLTSGNLTSETSLVSMNETGTFHASLSNLSANTTYYFRSKAVGHGTGYGAEKSFTTLVTTAPAVITNDAVNVTYNSVRLSGNLTARGTSSSANVSFQRGTSSGNYTAETNVQSVSATGTFVTDMSSLSSSTTYYFRVKADGSGHGITYGAEKSFTTSAAPSGGGGGGGGGAISLPLTGLSGTALQVDATGKTLNAVTLETPDKGGSVSIATGTKMVDKSGAAISSLTATVLTSPPAPPANGAVVAGYEMGPSGAQFTPPITLTLAFDSQKLAGVKTGDLYIAWWDGQQWQALESSVDPQTNTVSAQVSHFTQFALLGKLPPPITVVTPVVTPLPSVTPSAAPSKFVVSDLSVKPTISQPGEAVSITVKVANSGGTKGEYEIALSINGVIEDSKKLTLAAAASETIEFTVKKDVADTYRIDVNGLTGFFTVEKPAVATTSSAQALALAVEQPKSTPANRSSIIIILIAGLGVLGGAIFGVTRMKRLAR